MKNRITPASVIRKLLLAWLTATCVEYLLIPVTSKSLEGTGVFTEMSLLRLLIVTAAVMTLILALSRHFGTGQMERWWIVSVVGVLAAGTLIASFRWEYLVGCLLTMAVLIVFALKGWDSRREQCSRIKSSGRTAVTITAVLTVLYFLLVSAWGIGRVLSFTSPTYDFGIFSQMFYSMRTAGVPVTTLERERRMSHFYVHVSPIYYLMLPFYCLAPYPATLQVLQAAIMASAVIPLWKLGTLHGLNSWQKLYLCLLLLLFPAFAGGAGYDLHENCFLTPLLLWVLYAVDRKKTIWIFGAALLILGVKEDAAVYTATVALWLCAKGLLYKKRREFLVGVSLLLVSVIWFVAVTAFLSRAGDGVMTYRYDNFIYDGSGSLMTVIKSVILCPMKVLYECMDSEKLFYIAYTILPLFGLPLMTRRYERYILLIPYVLINLMSDYEYQHSLYFQYSFGSAAFLLYLTAVNLSDIRDSFLRSITAIAAAAVSLVCFSLTVLPEAVYYPVKSVRYSENYQQIRDLLATVPEGTSVAASTYYTVPLSERDILYDIQYATREQLLSVEYVAVDLTVRYEKYATGEDRDGLKNLQTVLLSNGYIPVERIPDTLIIYHREK